MTLRIEIENTIVVFAVHTFLERDIKEANQGIEGMWFYSKSENWYNIRGKELGKRFMLVVINHMFSYKNQNIQYFHSNIQKK